MNEWLQIQTETTTTKLYEIAIHKICTAILNVICNINTITETNADCAFIPIVFRRLKVMTPGNMKLPSSIFIITRLSKSPIFGN